MRLVGKNSLHPTSVQSSPFFILCRSPPQEVLSECPLVRCRETSSAVLLRTGYVIVGTKSSIQEKPQITDKADRLNGLGEVRDVKTYVKGLRVSPTGKFSFLKGWLQTRTTTSLYIWEALVPLVLCIGWLGHFGKGWFRTLPGGQTLPACFVLIVQILSVT